MSRSLLSKPTAQGNVKTAPNAAPENLRIGEPRDIFEQETDPIREPVMASGVVARRWSFSKMGIGNREPRKGAPGELAGGSGAGGEYQGKWLQRKLSVGSSSDPLELEADRVAAQVLAAPAKVLVQGAAPRIQRVTGPPAATAGTLPASINRVLTGPGQALGPEIQREMGQRFGHDFSRVRIHTDAVAGQSAQEANAHAYTVGQNIVFGAGRFAPGLQQGRFLLAHELTHVVQQSSGPAKSSLIQRKDAQPSASPTLEESDKGWIQAFGLEKWLQGTVKAWKEIQAMYAAAQATTFHPTEALLNGILTASRIKLDLGEAQIKEHLNGDPARLKEFRDAYRDMILAVVPKYASLTGKTPAEVFRAHSREIAEWAAPEEDISSVTAAAEPVRGVESTGIAFKKDDLKTVAGRSYWEAKAGKTYYLVEVGATGERFKADPEERDAVFSVLWQVRPANPASPATRLVTIPSRGNGPNGKPTSPLLYKLAFKPAKKDTKNMPSVEYEFVAEGGATTAAAAPEPDKNYTPSQPALTHSNFPANDIDAYWATNEGEHRRLYNWIENLAPASFDQVVTISTGKPARTTTFKVKGSKDKSGVSSLRIDYVGRLAPQTGAAPADYRAKTDAGDFALEEQQAKKDGKLGSVKIPPGISTAEAAELKYIIATYFEKGTRNAEVDVRVPSLDATGEILYTLRFLPDNNVEAIRVGVGTATRLDPNRLDAGRSQEFLALYKAKDLNGLAALIARRYPGLKITGKTVEELRVTLNNEINSKAGDAAWFMTNYGLTIMDSSAAEERLKNKTQPPYAPQQRAGLKNFERGELLKLEETLETFSLAVISRLRGVYLGRQDVSIERAGKALAPVKERTGITLTKGADITIIIFDQAAVNDETLFLGGRLGVLPTTSMTFAHEFGHAIGDQADIQKEFNKFVTARKINPVTKYAGSNAPKEFFPEAFALFNTDPEWMKANQPELYNWFAELAKTGKPPMSP